MRPSPTTLLRFLFAATILTGLLFAGCSKKDKSEIAVAEVEDNVISLEYFERKMNTIPAEELPPDIAEQSGREELLETMIKKEVMVLKAQELGLDEDGMVEEQARKISNLSAVTKMRSEVVAGSQEVSEEEIQDYYEMLPRKLMTSYMVFDYEKDALEAKALVEGGERWEVVAEASGSTAEGRDRNYTMPIRYGTVSDDFEREVFSMPVGAISDPIDSPYGYFLVRVDDVEFERVQPIDTLRDKIIASIQKQKEQLALVDFVQQVFDEYEFQIDDEALQIVYDGIPEDRPLEPPYPGPEELGRLEVPSEHLDKVLMSWNGETWTIRRYADLFDQSSIFGRPRREGRIGGLRRQLKEIAIRELMDRVAIDRGYGEKPEVQDEYRKRREQMMVTMLNEQLVRDQVKVTPVELEAYWEEHKEQYRQPETREVLALITETEADGLSAEIDLAGGATWEEVVENYCIPSDVREKKGHVGKMTADMDSPIIDIVFSLAEEGATSNPTELPDGKWALVRVTSIQPEYQPTLEEVRPTVGARVQGEKEDALFDELIDSWMADYEIKRYPDRLMDAVYAPNPVDNSVSVTFGG